MVFLFSYCENYTRVVPAVLIDSRATIPAIKNKVGGVVKSYVDSQVGQIGDSNIPYRIENELGVLAGYFTVQVDMGNRSATLGQKALRPAFQSYDSQISQQIANFILGNEWHEDILF